MPITKSLPQILKSLVPVGRADSVYEVASADRINAIQDALRLISRGDNIVAGNNVKKASGDGYVFLTARPRGRRGGGGAFPYPWQIYVLGDSTIRLNPGTINSIIPSNMFDHLPIDIGTWYVTLDVSTDGVSTTSAVIAASDTVPAGFITSTLNVAPDFFQIVLGLVVDGSPFNIIRSALFATPLETVQTIDPTPTPGDPIYDINYTWKVSSI